VRVIGIGLNKRSVLLDMVRVVAVWTKRGLGNVAVFGPQTQRKTGERYPMTCDNTRCMLPPATLATSVAESPLARSAVSQSGSCV
jgi:hypothetical protein